MEKMDLRKQVALLTEQKRISEQERIRQQAANQLLQEEYKQDTLRFSSRTSFFLNTALETGTGIRQDIPDFKDTGIRLFGR